MESEKGDLANFAKQVEDNINFYNIKLQDYQIYLKMQQYDEEINMLEEENMSIENQRNLLIQQVLNYEELLRLFILETFSTKFKQNYIPQNLLTTTNLVFFKYEMLFVFKQSKFSEQLFNFLIDYINESILYTEVQSILNDVISHLQFKEIEEFFLILAKFIENLIIEKNYDNYSKNTANFNFGVMFS